MGAVKMSQSGFQFLSQQWLWLLVPLWIYLAWWFSYKKTNQNSAIADVDTSANNHFYHPLAHKLNSRDSQGNKSQQRFWMKPVFWWQGIAISALIITTAQPILIGEKLPDPPPERDIIFLVDTSISMQLADYSLNGKPIKRMVLLRNMLDEFATKMAGEQLSVIIFAEQPFMLVPLTNDQNLIRRMLSRITTTLAGRYTAVGDALLMALKEANKQTDRHQTFILFTDADASRGKVTPHASAKLIAESNIPVFTIAIGSSQKKEYEEVQGGLYQAVDLTLLKNIADITGGESYQVHDSDAIKKALDSILNQRQNLAEQIPEYERESLYLYFFILGLLMLLLLQIARLLGSRYV